MTSLTLDAARSVLDAALERSAARMLNPLAVVVLDARGCLKAAFAQDGTSLLRAEIAHGKAYGALALGMGSRAIFQAGTGAGLLCRCRQHARSGPSRARAGRRVDQDYGWR